MTLVAGTFDDEQAANKAVQVILEHHFNRSQISMLVYEDGTAKEVPVVYTNGVGPGAAVGAAIGAVIGTIVMGPIALVAAGPVLALLEVAAAGAAAGSLTGALGGLGFWKESADLQAQDLSNGAIWVGIDTETGLAEAEAALVAAGARRISRTEPPGSPVPHDGP